MTKIEDEFVSQARWNAKGKSTLDLIKDNPENFFVDTENFSTDKDDLMEALGNLSNKRVLEYGSGRGKLSVALAKLGAEVTGIDIGEKLIEVSKNIAELNNVNCKFIEGNIAKLPFERNRFDFVVGNAILHHLPKKGVKDSLSEAYRVLIPGGTALFIEPVENSKIFDFIQNLVPLANRPSILEREKWKKHLKQIDDRALSNKELISAKGRFNEIEFKYYGFLIRLKRLLSNSKFEAVLTALDSFLTHRRSPLKKLSQKVLVKYKK